MNHFFIFVIFVVLYTNESRKNGKKGVQNTCHRQNSLMAKCTKLKGYVPSLCKNPLFTIGKTPRKKARKARKRCVRIEQRLSALCNDLCIGGELSETQGDVPELLKIPTNQERTGPYSDNTTENCYHDNGADYRGSTSVTVSGLECQMWTEQTPHMHIRTPDSPMFSNKGLGAHNYCRNPDGDAAPWCYTIHPHVRLELCTNIPVCTTHTPDITLPSQMVVDITCYSDTGVNYRGTTSTTVSGNTCQKWSRQDPHSHSRTAEVYPGRGLGEHNYCRNPDGEAAPWCYTTDPHVRFELCTNIPKCSEEATIDCRKGIGYGYQGPQTSTITGEQCTQDSYIYKVIETAECVSGRGASYAGKISVTQSGRACVEWRGEYVGIKGRACRNPGEVRERPWCYVGDTDWEYCDIAKCGIFSQKGVLYQPNKCSVSPHDTDMLQPWCHVAGSRHLCEVSECSELHSHDSPVLYKPGQECYWVEDLGLGYRGKTSTTSNGNTCQAWSSQTPHEHLFGEENEVAGIGNHNHCRNPDNEGKPWCYTTNPAVRWDICDVPECGGRAGKKNKHAFKTMKPIILFNGK